MVGKVIPDGETNPQQIDCAVFFQPAQALATHLPAHITVDDLTGIWDTDLRVFRKRIALRFSVTVTPNGIETRFSCPEAKLYDRSVLGTQLHRDIVRFDMDDFSATFTGTLDPLGPVIRGLFYRSGFYFPATLTRTDA